MTVVNQAVGWAPEATDATVIAYQAYSKGDLVRLDSKFNQTSGYGAGAFGVSVAYPPGVTVDAVTTIAHPFGIFAIALEDVVTGQTFRVRIRGRVEALAEQDATGITANDDLCIGAGELTDIMALVRTADIDAGAATTQAATRKILARSEAAYESETAGLIWVLFNGAEGFGTYVGSTPA